ncbi:MAG: hypothetical protein V4506_12800 [Bacteroidota bacterium]
MKQKPSKTFFLLLTASIILTTLTVLACGGGDWYNDEGSMFTPQIINQKESVPFFRTLETPFYDGYDDAGAETFKKTNGKEWLTFFENHVAEDALNYWLYDASLNQIDSMIFDIKGKPANLTEKSKQYSLKNVASSAKANAFLYYLGFAKRNETFAVIEIDYSWNTEKTAKPVTVTIDKQIAGGLTFYSKTSDPFLKERYAFQLERLYFFSKDFDKTIAFYNDNESVFKSENSMKWRALGYKAASLYKQKKYGASNYIYSIIFDQYEPLKKSAYLSFHPLQKDEWSQCLAAAKTTHEKEILWQLSGLYIDDVLAMKEILKLNPSSNLVDLLLVRAVNIEEGNILAQSYEDKKTAKPYTIDKNLLAFISDMSNNTASLNPIIWHLSAAYLNYIQGDYVLGDQQIKRAEKYRNDNPIDKAEYHLVNAFGKLRRSTLVNEKLETDLLPDLTVLFSKETQDLNDFRSVNAKEWTRKILAELYLKKGEPEKAELIFHSINPNRFNSIEAIQKMITYYEKPNRSPFEKLFFEKASLQKESYQELLGIRYAQQDKLDESLAAFKKISNTEVLYGNPFTIHTKDCHDCDHEAVQKTKYTKLSFIEKMMEMKATALAKPAEAAQNYFLIANGFYNMTYFGNARLFYDNRVDNSIYEYNHNALPEENNDLALKYYLLALQNSTDKEFKAKCTFMAAKCEQNHFFMNTPKGYEGDFKSGQYFASLKKEYAGTKYYSEVIRECSYFKTYLGK